MGLKVQRCLGACLNRTVVLFVKVLFVKQRKRYYHCHNALAKCFNLVVGHPRFGGVPKGSATGCPPRDSNQTRHSKRWRRYQQPPQPPPPPPRIHAFTSSCGVCVPSVACRKRPCRIASPKNAATTYVAA